MSVDDFETMVGSAGYRLARKYAIDGHVEVRIYEHPNGPLLRIEVSNSEVDDFHALTIEALLDEENFFEED